MRGIIPKTYHTQLRYRLEALPTDDKAVERADPHPPYRCLFFALQKKCSPPEYELTAGKLRDLLEGRSSSLHRQIPLSFL